MTQQAIRSTRVPLKWWPHNCPFCGDDVNPLSGRGTEMAQAQIGERRVHFFLHRDCFERALDEQNARDVAHRERLNAPQAHKTRKAVRP
jgi:hypothetical protein